MDDTVKAYVKELIEKANALPAKNVGSARPAPVVKSVAYHIGRADAKVQIISQMINEIEMDKGIRCALHRKLESLMMIHYDIMLVV